jgi:hypothetical protein
MLFNIAASRFFKEINTSVINYCKTMVAQMQLARAGIKVRIV